VIDSSVFYLSLDSVAKDVFVMLADDERVFEAGDSGCKDGTHFA
jgi:hypothetical protein